MPFLATLHFTMCNIWPRELFQLQNLPLVGEMYIFKLPKLYFLTRRVYLSKEFFHIHFTVNLTIASLTVSIASFTLNYLTKSRDLSCCFHNLNIESAKSWNLKTFPFTVKTKFYHIVFLNDWQFEIFREIKCRWTSNCKLTTKTVKSLDDAIWSQID